MNYPDYDPASPITPLNDAELGQLERLLDTLPGDAVMSLDGFDGFLTALAVAPTLAQDLPTDQWLPLLWGGDGAQGADEAAPFASKRQRKQMVVWALRHLRHRAEELARGASLWEPIFSVAEDEDGHEIADASDWCTGFLQAVDLMPGAFAGAWDDATVGPALAGLLALGGGLGDAREDPTAGEAGGGERNDGEDSLAESLDDLGVLDTLSRQVPDGVVQLHAWLRRG